MASFGAEIEGVEELRGKLRGLTQKMQRGALRNAFRGAGRIVEREAKTLVPVESGDLKDAIGTSVSATTTAVKVDVGVRRRRPGSPARYAHLVELGTAHSAPQPFLRPALDNKADEAVASIARALRPEIEKAARKQ